MAAREKLKEPSEFKIGEKVTIVDKDWGLTEEVRAITAVERFTPTGRMVLADGRVYRKDTRWGCWRSFGKMKGSVRKHESGDEAKLAARKEEKRKRLERERLVGRCAYLRRDELDNVPTEVLSGFVAALDAAKTKGAEEEA